MQTQKTTKKEAAGIPTSEKTAFELSAVLPDRPVPDLSTSFEGLRASAAPFSTSLQKISHRLFTKLSKAVLSPTQAGLHHHQEGWPDRAMQQYYLTNRRSLAFYSNVFYLMEDDPTCSTGLDRAAAIIRSALEFYRSLKDGTLKPDSDKGISWGTEPYHPLFSTSRLPQKDQDKILSQLDKQHVVIAYQGSFYEVKVLEMAKGAKGKKDSLAASARISSYPEIRKTIQKIIRTAASPQNYQEVGGFTTLPREPWAKIRRELLQSPMNQKTLESVDGALLFVALDFDDFPKDREETLWLLAHAHPENRWYDKSHQFIISGNGKVGLNRDHTAIDGTPTSRYVSEVYLRAGQILQENQEGTITRGTSTHTKALPVKSLHWKLNNRQKVALQEALKQSQLECQERELLVFDFPDLGDGFFRRHSVNSDPALQLIIQFAAYQCMGKLMSVNEAVNMRHFRNGRYDTIFCVTEESKDFVTRAALPKKNLPQLRKLFLKAVHAHRTLVKKCKKGESPYLHLTALMGLQPNSKFLKLTGTGISLNSSIHWNNFGFSKVMNSDITTSNPGIKPGLEIIGFTDTAPDVIGIAYLIDLNRIRFFIKTDHLYFGKAEEFKNQITSALKLLREILLAP